MTTEKNLDIRAFLLTISTRSDIHEQCVCSVTKHIKSQCDYYHCVVERGENGKKHYHAIMLYRKARDKRSLRRNIWERYVAPWHGSDGSLSRIAVKMQTAPGDNWYREYLRKEEEVEVVATKWDDDDVGQYFPDDSTQQILQASHGERSRDGWIASHLADYAAKYADNSFEAAFEFTFRWYVEHKRDPTERFLRERAHFLYCVRSGDFGPMPGDMQWHNQRAGSMMCEHCGSGRP